MTKRQEVTAFARLIGIKAQGHRHGVILSHNVYWNGKTWKGWVDSLESWDEAYAFLLKARDDHIVSGKPYPWQTS